jgi:hypothetical protein
MRVRGTSIVRAVLRVVGRLIDFPPSPPTIGGAIRDQVEKKRTKTCCKELGCWHSLGAWERMMDLVIIWSSSVRARPAPPRKPSGNHGVAGLRVASNTASKSVVPPLVPPMPRRRRDEAQDFPLDGREEIVETRNRFLPGSSWRAHGVPRGSGTGSTRSRWARTANGRSSARAHDRRARPQPELRPLGGTDAAPAQARPGLDPPRHVPLPPKPPGRPDRRTPW